MHERAALLAGEHGSVELLAPLLAARGQDHAGTRTTQGLVDRRRHHVGEGDGVRVQARGHEAREVSHIHPEGGADLVRDVTEGLEVKVTRVGGPTGNDDARTLGEGSLANLLRLDAHGLAVNLVGDGLVVLAREVQAHAVGQVTAVSQREAEDRVADVRHRHERGSVGLRTGVGLNVDVVAAENLLRTFDGEGLCDIHELTATVVTAARVALGVLIGQDRALRLEDGARDKVLRGDHLESVTLATKLGVQNGLNLRIQLRKCHVIEGIHGVLLLIIR